MMINTRLKTDVLQNLESSFPDVQSQPMPVATPDWPDEITEARQEQQPSWQRQAVSSI